MNNSSTEACGEQTTHYIQSLTSLKAGRGVLPALGSVRPPRGGVSRTAGVQVSLQAWQEGHVVQLLVWVLGVEGHWAQRRRVVSQSRGQTGGAAVHHTGIYKGGDGVELLSVAMRQDSSHTAGSRAEERHATLDATARVWQRNLGREFFIYLFIFTVLQL